MESGSDCSSGRLRMGASSELVDWAMNCMPSASVKLDIFDCTELICADSRLLTSVMLSCTAYISRSNAFASLA